MKILLICQDAMGPNMAGPAIRYCRLAEGLGRNHNVTLLVTQPITSGFCISGVDVIVMEGPRHRELKQLCASMDAVITQPQRLQLQHAMSQSGTPIFYDMYAPIPIELTETGLQESGTTERQVSATVAVAQMEWSGALRTGSGFLVASDIQADYVLGGLTQVGRLTPIEYSRSPALTDHIIVVPYGLDEVPAHPPRRPIRAMFPIVQDEDFVLLWSGGIWNWLDPLTVIRACAQLAHDRPSLRLVFMGTEHPDSTIRMSMTAQAIELAKSLGVYGNTVLFNHDWIPMNNRYDFLREADVGVVAHFDRIESHLSFRQRVVDHLWAGLPTLGTRGSSLTDRAARDGAGFTLEYQDVDTWASAIGGLMDSPEELRAMGSRAMSLSAQYRWTSIVDHLETSMMRITSSARTTSNISPSSLARYSWTQARKQGIGAAARKVIHSVRP